MPLPEEPHVISTEDDAAMAALGLPSAFGGKAVSTCYDSRGECRRASGKATRCCCMAGPLLCTCAAATSLLTGSLLWPALPQKHGGGGKKGKAKGKAAAAYNAGGAWQAREERAAVSA